MLIITVMTPNLNRRGQGRERGSAWGRGLRTHTWGRGSVGERMCGQEGAHRGRGSAWWRGREGAHRRKGTSSRPEHGWWMGSTAKQDVGQDLPRSVYRLHSHAISLDHSIWPDPWFHLPTLHSLDENRLNCRSECYATSRVQGKGGQTEK